MIDNITNTSGDVQQTVGASIATALRDRQAYVIPIQPNRSLPVRPAPHHTPSRSTIVIKTSLGRITSFVPTQPSTSVIVSSPTNQQPEALQVKESILTSPSPTEEKVNKEEEEAEEEEEISMKSSIMKRSLNRDQNVVITTDNLIDISQSPKRTDSNVNLDEFVPEVEPTSASWTSEKANSKDKRKRRRKIRKKNLEESRQDASKTLAIRNAETGSRTVPPLRLKKIQTLQEPFFTLGGTNWHGIMEREINKSFNGDAIGEKRLRISGEGDSDFGSKYRIVSGHTPPYETCVESSVCESRFDGLDDAKLRYKHTKLRLKLRELKRKTLELGKEMLRSVLTTSTGTRGCRLRQTMNRYEDQIEELEMLLNALPKTAGHNEDIDDVCYSLFYFIYK